MKNQKNNPTYSLTPNDQTYFRWEIDRITDNVVSRIKKHRFYEDDLDWSKVSEKIWQLFLTEEAYEISEMLKEIKLSGRDDITKELIVDAFRDMFSTGRAAEDFKFYWQEKMCEKIFRENLPVSITYTFEKV